MRMKYCNQFFKTKEEAKAFQKQHGYGALYSNEKGSRTKKAYATELRVRGSWNDEFINTYPFVVAWNEEA